MKTGIRRIRSHFKVVFDKKRYEEQIQELMDSNSNLRVLKLQAEQWCRPAGARTSQTKYSLPQEDSMPDFNLVNQVSEDLYHVFSSWQCSDSALADHGVNLCLEAQHAKKAVCLDVVILSGNPSESS